MSRAFEFYFGGNFKDYTPEQFYLCFIIRGWSHKGLPYYYYYFSTRVPQMGKEYNYISLPFLQCIWDHSHEVCCYYFSEWTMLFLKCPCNVYVIYKIVLFGKKIIKFDLLTSSHILWVIFYFILFPQSLSKYLSTEWPNMFVLRLNILTQWKYVDITCELDWFILPVQYGLFVGFLCGYISVFWFSFLCLFGLIFTAILDQYLVSPLHLCFFSTLVSSWYWIQYLFFF